MAGTATRLRQIARRLDELAPREPVVIRMVWHDDATGDEEPFAEWTVDGRAPRVIHMTSVSYTHLTLPTSDLV